MTSQNRRLTMKDKHTKYPQLRFKGFTDPWEKRTLGQTTTKAKSYSLSRDVERDHETGYRYIHYGDIHTGVADIVTEHTKLPNIEPANYDELRVNDLVVADASEDYQGIAEPAVVVGFPTHLVAGLHTITLRPSSASSLYLYYLLHTDSFKHFGYQMGTGLKVFGISWSNLSKFTFMIPSRPEQEMIVKLIESVDNLIAVNQRKLAKLKELKQGYLQKLFPKNGSKFPQLRFAGFADAWEQRKLIDLLNQPITDGPHETPNLVEKGIPFISADAIVDNRIDFSRKRGFITEEYDLQCRKKYGPELYDVYLVKSGSTVGKVAIVETTKQFNIWSPLAAMRCKGKTNPYFLYFLFQTKENQNQVKSKASNGTQPNLSMRELEQFNVQISPLHDEQQKIGAFFKQLDSLITLHQRKLEKLQELKKGYLQKMFV